MDDELYQEIVSVIRMNRQGLTMDAIARAVREGLTQEEAVLFNESFQI